MAFASQLVPLFRATRGDERMGPAEAPPLSIIRIESLERAPREICAALAVAHETGQIVLPEGRRGSLRNCLLIMTTGLCAKEILDEAPRIGFSGTLEENDEEEARIQALCAEQAEEAFGPDLVGRLDGLVVFHRLQSEHLTAILHRRVARLREYMALGGFDCRMEPAAREFLLERSGRDLRLGSSDLIRCHRKFVEFPVADLIMSGCVPPGGRVLIDRRSGEEHLHFTVSPDVLAIDGPASAEVTVEWNA